MEANNKKKMALNINRAVAFVAGGLLVFAVMSFTVVNNIATENEELSEALDTSRFEAGRLLEAAKAQLSSGDYAAAEASLTALSENQPGTAEAAEGKALLARVQEEASSTEQRWEAALPSIREEWTSTMAAELRADFDEVRAKFENELEENIQKAWDKARADVRAAWAEEQQQS